MGKRLTHEDNFLFDGKFISGAEQEAMPPTGVCYSGKTSCGGVGFYAVSDGMGGHNAGEAASRICVSKLAALEPTVQDCTRMKDLVAVCQKTIADTNDEVCRLSRANAAQRGMGATLVLLVFCGSECAVMNIGDSRAYFFDGRALAQISKDHTEGQRMLDLGLLSKEELAMFPARKNLHRYIGFDAHDFTLTADVSGMRVKEGVYMLCSDGITDSLTDDEIASLLCNPQSIEIAGNRMIERAVSARNADNATVILISTKG
jgi:protein phosphatase